jgi:hypothetical protein
MARPSLRDALQSFSNAATHSGRLGRLGISQSFRERGADQAVNQTPSVSKDPHIDGSGGQQQSPTAAPLTGVTRSLTKKLFSFNRSEMKRINKFLGISGNECAGGTTTTNNKSNDPTTPPPLGDTFSNNIYDIAEDDTASIGKGLILKGDGEGGPPTSSFCDTSAVKPPPRPKRERSKSFTPRTRPLHHKASALFNRSLSQLPKSASNSSIRTTAKSPASVHRSESCRKLSANSEPAGGYLSALSGSATSSKRTLSSSDLVLIFPEDEERRSFKDIRKILSSPSITSSSSSSTGSTSSQASHTHL